MISSPSSLRTTLLTGFLVFTSCCCVLRASEEQRMWKYEGASYQGRLIVIDDQRVVIVMPDGQTKEFVCDKLSTKDQEYARAKGKFIAPMPPPTKKIPGDVMKALEDVKEPLYLPEMDGAMWQIAENSPDVDPYNTGYHNACDFSIWQAADGTWQLVACIRGTSWPGATRLFHRWEAQKLTDEMWTPKGIFYKASTEVGQDPSSQPVQAPHCFVNDGKHYMFYNARGAYCMISDDGKSFAHHKNCEGSYKFFDMGRDVMLFHDADTWYAYYCGRRMHARTAKKLEGPWSEEAVDIGVSSNPESPFVVKYDDGYYLWSQKLAYYSKDLLDFSGPVIADMADTAGKGYAPEIILHEGQYYFAAYGRGIWLGKMKWVKKSPEEIVNWRVANYDKYRPRTPEEKAIQSAKVRRWRETEGKKAKDRAIQEWKAKHGSNTANRSSEE